MPFLSARWGQNVREIRQNQILTPLSGCKRGQDAFAVLFLNVLSRTVHKEKKEINILPIYIITSVQRLWQQLLFALLEQCNKVELTLQNPQS